MAPVAEIAGRVRRVTLTEIQVHLTPHPTTAVQGILQDGECEWNWPDPGSLAESEEEEEEGEVASKTTEEVGLKNL